MDPLTQATLGAAAAVAFAPEDKVKQALWIGVVAGMAADADVFIRSTTDPLLHLDFHRHFTHSLFFVPFGALIVSGLLWPLLLRWGSTSFKSVYLFALLGYLSHAPLDACTTYGTQLLWPFSSARIAWNNVAVVDFFFTLPLLALVVLAYRSRSARLARFGLVYAVLYLLFGVVQHARAEAMVHQLASQRGHQPTRLEAKPTLGNLWLFRAIYEHDGTYYIDAVRPGLIGEPKVYQGSSIPRFDPTSYPRIQPGTRQYRDIERFAHFSDGFLAHHPQVEFGVGDIRYALLPNDVKPLWGIILDPNAPEAHVRFQNWRAMSDQTWPRYKAMLLGRDLK